MELKVWGDALCIDQQDLPEKAIGVKRMGEIYTKANRVSSYFGEEGNQSGDALDVLIAFGEALNTEQSVAHISLEFFRNTPTDSALRLAQLLARPYWARI